MRRPVSASSSAFAVRRTLVRATMKDLNRLVISLIKHLDALPLDQIGSGTETFLLEQTAESRVWPTDEELIARVPGSKLYGTIRQNRLCMVLSAVEQKRRSERSEDVSLPTNLQIEHVMPQKWRINWSEGTADDPIAAAERDRKVHTIGNLTLLTGRLNAPLSNRPWLDSDAAKVASSGPAAGKGKRSLIDQYSLLVLNKELVQHHPTAWTEDDIAARGLAIVKDIAGIWPRP